MNILLTRKFHDRDVKYLQDHLLPEAKLIIPKFFDEQTLITHCPDAHVLLGPYFTKSILSACKQLKLIQIPWTGVENINFEILENVPIKLCNSHSNSSAVAEFGIALFFSLIKKIPYHDKLLRNNEWNRPKFKNEAIEVDPFSPVVSELTIGILGFGSIGSKIYNYLKGFGCKFIVLDNKPSLNLGEHDKIVTMNNIDLLLQNADVVFVCLPLTDDTRNLINAERISKLKSSSYIINISRGDIINEKALYEACFSYAICGAALDTWWYSPDQNRSTSPSKFSFSTLKNVIMSPHRAGMVKSALPHLDDAILNINNLVLGKQLINIIDIKKKY